MDLEFRSIYSVQEEERLEEEFPLIRGNENSGKTIQIELQLISGFHLYLLQIGFRKKVCAYAYEKSKIECKWTNSRGGLSKPGVDLTKLSFFRFSNFRC